MSALASNARGGLLSLTLVAASSGCVVEARRDPFAAPVVELADAALAQSEHDYTGSCPCQLANGDEDQEARLKSARLNAIKAARLMIAEYRKRPIQGGE